MKKRKLGRSGIEIAPLVLGGNVFGWTVDEPTGFKILDAFVAAGYDAIDTADVYSRWVPGHVGGESETMIGKWMKARGNRAKLIIATKVGMDMGEGRTGLSKSRINTAVEESLMRLQTDYIDLYQSHQDDPKTALEETLGAYSELIKQGKVRAIGASNYSGERLAAALEVSRKNNLPRYETLQPNYSLVQREPYESEMEPVCSNEHIGVINYFPLASGFLTGKYRSEADLKKSQRGERVKIYLNDHGLHVLAALDRVAENKGATPAQVALAWCMAQPSITAPIVSATSLDQLYDLLESTELQLDAASLELLNEASDPKNQAKPASA